MLGALYPCSVTGTVQDPTVENGDRPFCAQVMSALKVAKIPPAQMKKLSNI